MHNAGIVFNNFITFAKVDENSAKKKKKEGKLILFIKF